MDTGDDKRPERYYVDCAYMDVAAFRQEQEDLDQARRSLDNCSRERPRWFPARIWYRMPRMKHALEYLHKADVAYHEVYSAEWYRASNRMDEAEANGIFIRTLPGSCTDASVI